MCECVPEDVKHTKGSQRVFCHQETWLRTEGRGGLLTRESRKMSKEEEMGKETLEKRRETPSKRRVWGSRAGKVKVPGGDGVPETNHRLLALQP